MKCFVALALTRRLSSRVVPAGVIAALAFVGSTVAQGAGFERNERCARMGEDFVAIVGSDNCVRIGGHVRVDIANGHANLPTGSTRDGIRPASERFHVRPTSHGRLIGLFPR